MIEQPRAPAPGVKFWRLLVESLGVLANRIDKLLEFQLMR